MQGFVHHLLFPRSHFLCGWCVWRMFTVSCPWTLLVLLPVAVQCVVHFLSSKMRCHDGRVGRIHPGRFSGSYLLPNWDLGLQLIDAVLNCLLSVMSMRRRDCHYDAGLSHLHPPEEETSPFHFTQTVHNWSEQTVFCCWSKPAAAT